MGVADYVIAVVGGLVSLWLTASFVLWMYWLYDDGRERFLWRHRKVGILLAIGGFVFVLVILISGMEFLLGFLPESWGSYDEEGEFHTVRDTISFLFGVFTALALADAYNRLTMVQRAHRALKSLLEIQEWNKRIRNFTESAHLVYERYRQRLSDLEERNNLIEEERSELSSLHELFKELERAEKKGAA